MGYPSRIRRSPSIGRAAMFAAPAGVVVAHDAGFAPGGLEHTFDLFSPNRAGLQDDEVTRAEAGEGPPTKSRRTYACKRDAPSGWAELAMARVALMRDLGARPESPRPPAVAWIRAVWRSLGKRSAGRAAGRRVRRP